MFARIKDGRADLVFDWLAQGHAATASDENGVALIKWCAYYGDVSAVRYLLANGESLDTLGPNFDLNGAVFHGHWQLCQFLLESGADANYPLPDSNETPLHAALTGSNHPAFEHIIALLLAHGADPNRATTPGVETGSFMRDSRTKGETPLHRAAAFGSAASMQMLLDAGAQIDAKDANGDSPLSWASWHNRPASILRKLCYGEFTLHPDYRSPAQETVQWNAMAANLLGKPHFGE